MIEKIRLALRKLTFCWRVTDNFTSFINLIWFTKKYKWSKKYPGERRINDLLLKYSLHFNGKKFNVYLRAYSGDIDIFYEVFLKQVYKFPINDNPHIIVDLGANTGLATLYFLCRFPEAKFILVEPFPANLAVLKKNLAEEIRSEKVMVVEAAINDKTGAVFFSNPSLTYNAKIAEQDNNEEYTSVKGIKMTDLLQQNDVKGIDLIKIDIEGAETKLFASDTSWLRHVKHLVVEFHSASAHKTGAEILLKNGFTLQQQLTRDILFWIRE